MSVELGKVGVFGTCRGDIEPMGHCSIQGTLVTHRPKESFPVCFHTGVVSQMQWSQKNGKKRRFLLRLSLLYRWITGPILVPQKRVSCVTEVICRSRNLTWESWGGGGIRVGKPEARQTKQLHHTHLFAVYPSLASGPHTRLIDGPACRTTS